MTQNDALAILKTGANVFLTGEPGSGKTHTVNRFVAWLRERGIEPAVTASTGIAATHIGGMTIHSWSGIGVKSHLTKQDLNSIANNKRVARRVHAAHILIIDEISMLSAQTLGMVEIACRAIRGGTAPFGGLQIVLVGDFFQLPPITAREKDAADEGALFEIEQPRTLFAFDSPAWHALHPTICYLSEQYRQSDAVFLEILSAIRSGSISKEHRATLETRLSQTTREGITQFFSHNTDVDRVNSAKLSKLRDKAHIFTMESRGSKQLVLRLTRGCLSPETLHLKTGAQVMFTKNDFARHRFVNGTLGAVTGFSKENGFPIVTTNAGKTIFAEPMEWSMEEGGHVLARIMQIPLRLAWAITVHKSQGMSLDAAHMDLSDAFEHGQGYVAISRVRTLAGLSLAGFNDRALEVHPNIALKDIEFRGSSQVAEESLARTSPAELEKQHNDFMRTCGGSLGPNREVKSVAHLNTYDQTKELVLQKLPLEEIAKGRGMAVTTIVGHLEKLVEKNEIDPHQDLVHLKPEPERFEKIKEAFNAEQKRTGENRLAPVRGILGDLFTFDELRLARLFLTKE